MKKSSIILIIALAVLAAVIIGFLIYTKFTGYAVLTSSNIYRSARYLSMDSRGTKISVYVYIRSTEPVLGVSENIPAGFNVTSLTGNGVVKDNAVEWLFVSGTRGIVAYTLSSPSQVRQVNLTGKWYTADKEGNITLTSLKK
ncbi:hypothetical protein FJZ19_03140 [Candidatus Pacearchaeota archaeon]|nr:hypothetical protein [Candidatus Pacearchaeota archaeon]